jgi:16S rRNA (guanine527-N7)-methyltransferase
MQELISAARQMLGLELTPQQVSALELFDRELRTWNERHSLTAIREAQKIQMKHFLDSLTCLLALRGSAISRVVDVGTGAGFPGLPLKIVCPQMQLTLLDSVGKKVDFCRHLVALLGLDGVQVIQARAENVGQLAEHREQYDWALARAVAKMPVLMEYLLPLARVGGQVLAQKGESGPAEAHAAEHSIHILGGRLRQVIPVTLPTVTEERYLVVVDKVAATPGKYPRRAGIPAKRPLQG